MTEIKIATLETGIVAASAAIENLKNEINRLERYQVECQQEIELLKQGGER